MPKDPWFKFYPADWNNDNKLQSCTLAARGLLIQLMCIIHQSEKPGYLLINGVTPPSIDVSSLVKTHHKTYSKHLVELLDNGVLEQGESGEICCPRMVREQTLREIRKRTGKLGGNPNLVKVDVKVDDKVHLNSKSQKSESEREDNYMREGEPSLVHGSVDDKGKPRQCPHRGIILLYHEILPMMPQVRIWGDNQKKFLKTRWNEDRERQTLDWWRQYFEYVARSDWLTGKGDKGWTASLEWLVRASSFTKVVNGTYHRGAQAVTGKEARTMANLAAWLEKKEREDGPAD